MGPPPSTTSRFGNASRDHSASDVRHPTVSMPGIGGTTGRAPAAITMLRVVRVRTPSAVCTSTDHGDVIVASPLMHSTPSDV